MSLCNSSEHEIIFSCKNLISLAKHSHAGLLWLIYFWYVLVRNWTENTLNISPLSPSPPLWIEQWSVTNVSLFTGLQSGLHDCPTHIHTRTHAHMHAPPTPPLCSSVPLPLLLSCCCTKDEGTPSGHWPSERRISLWKSITSDGRRPGQNYFCITFVICIF